MKYRSDIDGLRALAVLSVVMFHAGFGAFGGGYVGVDVFFVISGYLITGVIASEIAERRFSLLSFYERRVRRIFPALFSVVLVSSVIASILFLPTEFAQFGRSVTATAFFVANIEFWAESGYFDSAAETKPLLHTWSLAVEEQFYIVFPALVLLVSRFRKERWTPFILVIFVVSFALSAWGVENEPSASFFLAPARAWEILLGSLLALHPISVPFGRRGGEFIAALGLALIAWSVFAFEPETAFPGPNALIPCLGAGLIIWAGAAGSSTIGRLLSTRPLVLLGLVSYSFYLWHWPALVFLRYYVMRELTQLESAAAIGVSLLAGIASWRFIEKPFRGADGILNRRGLWSWASAAVACSVVLGSAGSWSHGWPSRFPGYANISIPDREFFRERTCFLYVDQRFDEWPADACTIDSGSASSALLWGDSFAAQYVAGFVANRDSLSHNVVQYTASGCAPALDYDPGIRPHCMEFNRNVGRVISELEISTVVMAARWEYALENGYEFEDLAKTIGALERMGVGVVVMGQTPVFASSMEALTYRSRVKDRAPNVLGDHLNRELSEWVGAAAFIDPLPLFCRAGLCRFRERESYYFRDQFHLSAVGSDRVVEAFLLDLNAPIRNPRASLALHQ